MMKHHTRTNPPLGLTVIVVGTLAGIFSYPGTTHGDVPSKRLMAKAKITRAKATTIALKAMPNSSVGTAELEEKNGGLRWALNLKTPGTTQITEISVDAVTGKILEHETESEKEEIEEHSRDQQKSTDTGDSDRVHQLHRALRSVAKTRSWFFF